jgi:molybdopterin molybdotransferase
MASDLLAVEEALKRILSAMPLMPAEEVPLTEAHGRTAAADIAARRTQPPEAVSAMDGYAVRGADVAQAGAKLKRIGTAPAGHVFQGTVGPGEAVRIFTGGALPEGADTIVIQEDVIASAEADGAMLEVTEATKSGAFVRAAGLDFREGDIRIKAGKVMTARDVGMAAAMNVPWIEVRRKPRVAILPTGDEIIRPGDPTGPNKIVSSNSYALAALVRACGGEPTLLGIAPDTVEGIQAMVRGARGADILITTGGASVGEHDLIRQALGTDAFGPDGLELDFWKIAMRPGKPLIFGHIARTPLLGLPGNPVSTIVCGTIFLRPAIATMLGRTEPHTTVLKARLAKPLKENDRRQDYLRAVYHLDENGEAVAEVFERQDSSMLALLADANCLLIRPPHAPAAPAGEKVDIIPLGIGSVSI